MEREEEERRNWECGSRIEWREVEVNSDFSNRYFYVITAAVYNKGKPPFRVEVEVSFCHSFSFEKKVLRKQTISLNQQAIKRSDTLCQRKGIKYGCYCFS